MANRRLLWQLFPSYLLIIILSLVAINLYAYFIISNIYTDVKANDLKARAQIIQNQILDTMRSGSNARLDSLCKVIGTNANTRITVILPDGKVIADTKEDPAVMDNHAGRPEIREAMNGGSGMSIRYSNTIEKELIYVALPLMHGERMIGVLRVSVPITFIEQTLEAIRERFIIAGTLITIIVAVISLIISRRISRPLEAMRRGVERFANGELTFRIGKPSSTEMAKLTDALNQMAAQLNEKIRTIVEQKNEQEAVLESMVEAVIAVDNNRRVINVNQAASGLFPLSGDSVIGKDFKSIVKNPELCLLVDKTLQSTRPVEEEIVLREEQEKYFLQVHGTVLMNAQDQVIGAVIVMNDVTRLRRLEKVRRDFVANVSHEIRTPLTSIKGFAETLLDGAIDDAETARGFVRIIAKQSNRLNAIIEDLLILARLEQEDERTQLEFSENSLEKVLDSALQVCSPKAMEKNVELHLDYQKDMKLKMNPDLLEQALVNLIDNAIKFSPENSQIAIQAAKKNGQVSISVRDHGVGIHKKHLPRLFERFYRVDKARSRSLGGTGLGLAIVKHIAQVHGGSIEVQSEPGKGSTFFLTIPNDIQSLKKTKGHDGISDD